MKLKFVVIYICILLIAATITVSGITNSVKNSTLPIFPGAEGFGTFTRGAYNGDTNPVIYKITNLNADGPGSLKAALEDTKCPRIIIFEVSGTIELNDYIWVKNPYVFIAGQTAPSPGITLKGGGLKIYTHDVIIQHLRIRIGDKNGVDFDWRDGLDVGEYDHKSYNVVIDHCSISWATDENVGIGFDTHNVTFQWCIISEGLYNSYHPKGPHSMGLITGPDAEKISIHHNLFAHNADRNPLIGGSTLVEVINNVCYNWKWDATKFEQYSGYGPQLGNIIANYYKRGPNTISDYGGINLEYAKAPSKMYIHNNIDTKYRTSDYQDDWTLVNKGKDLRINSPAFKPSGISIQNAFDAYNAVLNNAGARPNDRDSADKRVVQEVKYGLGHFIDSQDEVKGWPNLAKKKPCINHTK